ncbi:TIGR02391 family protein [Paenibacillus sp. FSL H8-0332]|uniref:TIGR02391 family protein n=1 Tax=Paenibacillus sp. FSL H8-0332 TaxID=2954742 RepID=UPI0030D35330
MRDKREIFKEIATGLSNQPLSSLLTKFLILSHDINAEFEQWAKLELSGYFQKYIEDDTKIPEYRMIVGQYTTNNGTVITFENPDLLFVQEYNIPHGVDELEEFSTRQINFLGISDPHRFKLLRDKLGVEAVLFNFTPSSVKGVLNRIRLELIDKINFLRGFIIEDETEEETINSLILSQFHPIVRQSAEGLFADGHYRQAILDTYINLVESVKIKSAHYNSDGSPLMQTVFSVKNPLLTISDNSDEQMGFMWLFSGAVMGIRNAKAHRVDEHPDKQTTLEILGFASFLLKSLDAAKTKEIP